MVVAGWLPLLRGGSTVDARWHQMTADVARRLASAFAATTRTARELARRDAIVQGLRQDAESPQELFQAIERQVEHPAERLAITILDASGAARAWYGRPSELSGAATTSPSRSAVTASALGFRSVRFEPVVEKASGQRLGTIVVEQVISETRVGGLVSERFRLSTAAGDVDLRAGVPEPASSDGGLLFTAKSPDGAAVVTVSSEPARVEREIQTDRRLALSSVLALVAAVLVLAAGRLLDRFTESRAPRRALGFAVAIALVLLGARALLWMALPALFARGWQARLVAQPLTGAADVTAPASWFLRSSIDLGLSAAWLLAVAALLSIMAVRSRVAWRGTRRWPARNPLAFIAAHVLAGAVAGAVLVAAESLLARSISVIGLDTFSMSLDPWSPSRWLSLFGIILVEAAAVWLALAVLASGLAPFRMARRSRTALAAALIWAATIAAVALLARRAGQDLSWTLPLSGALAIAAALFASRAAIRFRRAGASARLLAFALAFLVPALLVYPALRDAAQARTRALVEHRYSPQTLHHRDELREALRTTLGEIDAMSDLPALLRLDTGPAGTERAFGVWSQTALARARLTSSLELYAADGRLMSRFALNFPEYEATAQVTRSERCAWQIVGEARPFGAEERAALHAERALCDAAGRPVGSVVVHVMLDYSALPFLSPENPYREVFRTESSARDAGHPRQMALVIYGWSLLPVYTSGVQVWPIDDAQFSRIYASRAGFWTTLRQRDETWHVYFVNDRSGIYALGYPALSALDHLVHLAELVTFAAIVYMAGLALAAVYNRVARRRTWTGRALLRDVRASFYRKLLIAFVAASIIPVLALALVIRAYFVTLHRGNVNAEAARIATVAQHALEELSALLRQAGLTAPPINDDLMVEVSQMIGRDVNVFEGATLLATSQRDLFASGLLPTRTPEEVYREIVLGRQPTFVGEATVGELRYLVAAAPVAATGRNAIITVPLASRQQEIEREIDQLDRGLLLAVLLCIAVGAALGLPVAERIADPVRRLTRAARRIARGDFDTRVAIRSRDELRRLVDAFNQMAAELKTQQQQLERTHRLEAWAEMARQVAHEIKNPLTPIQLSAEHLRRVHADRGQPLSPVLDSCVESILGQVHLLRQIAGEFSSFASSPTARPSTFPVRPLVDDVITPYLTGLGGRIDVHVEVPDGLPDVVADRVLVARALTNIIENALHAMPGRGALRIRAAAEAAFVAIAIGDTGAGMDEEALARVFEPYFSTKASGTGLGLTIASRNIELSGGSIAVASRKGEGTTVTVRLKAVV